MEFQVHLNNRPFNAIKNGTKQVECRVPSEEHSRYQQMKAGDLIDFENEDSGEHLKVKIKYIHRYSDFRSMLETEGVNRVLSSEPKTIEHGITSLESFSEYKENVVKYGVFAICVKLLCNK